MISRRCVFRFFPARHRYGKIPNKAVKSAGTLITEKPGTRHPTGARFSACPEPQSRALVLYIFGILFRQFSGVGVAAFLVTVDTVPAHGMKNTVP